jgi:hypothetical protein
MSATSSFGFDIAAGSGWRRFHVQLFKWALNLPDRIHRDAGIARRRIDVAMAEQSLNDANVDLLFQKMRREAVSQRSAGSSPRWQWIVVVLLALCVIGYIWTTLH